MGLALTVVGFLIIAFGLLDMFRALLHPRGEGDLSNAVISALWAISRRLGHRLGSAVGPVGMVTTVVVWVLLQGLGWALIYLPHIPEGFTYDSGIDPDRYPDLIEALYVSFVTLATLGFGDMVATEPFIRALAPLEALVGFAVLTAALTWFMQIYPPLTRRRALALRLHGLAEAGVAGSMSDLPADMVSRILDQLATDIDIVCVDLTQHSETYYFHDEDPGQSLSRQIHYALELRDAAAANAGVETGFATSMLSASLENVAATLRGFVRVGDEADLRQVFRAYAVDHARSARD